MQLASARSESLGPWRALARYIDDGELPADNNWVENGMPADRHWAQQMAACRLAARAQEGRRNHERPGALGQAEWGMSRMPT